MSITTKNNRKLLYENKYQKIENTEDSQYANDPLIISYNQNNTKDLFFNFKFKSELDPNNQQPDDDINIRTFSTSLNNNNYKYNNYFVQNKDNISNNITNSDDINLNTPQTPVYKNLYIKNNEYNDLISNNNNYYFDYTNYESNPKNYENNKIYISDISNYYNKKNPNDIENRPKNINAKTENEKYIPQIHYNSSFATAVSQTEKIKVRLKKNLTERENTNKEDLCDNKNHYSNKNLNYYNQDYKTNFYINNYYNNTNNSDLSINSINLKDLNDEQEKINKEIEKELFKLKTLEEEKNKLVAEEQERRKKILFIITQQKVKEINNRKKYEECFQKKLEDEEKLKQIKNQQLQKMKEINELTNNKKIDEKKYSLLFQKKNNTISEQNSNRINSIKYSMTLKEFYNPLSSNNNNIINNYTNYTNGFSFSPKNNKNISNSRVEKIVKPFLNKNSFSNENSQVLYDRKKIKKYSSATFNKKSNFLKNNYLCNKPNNKLKSKPKNSKEESKINKERSRFRISCFYDVNSRNKKFAKQNNLKNQKTFNSSKKLPFSISKEREKIKEKINNQKTISSLYSGKRTLKEKYLNLKI